MFELTACLSIVGAWAGLFGRWWWLLDLAAHFYLYYGLFALLALAWFAWKKKRAAAIFAVLTVVLVGAKVSRVLIAERPVASGQGLRVLSLNVLTANTQKQRVLDFIKREDADVVFLMEVDSEWEAALEPLRERYPHRLVEAREDNFGVAFLSRLGTADLKTISLGAAAEPTITATLTHAGREFRFIGTHPLPPVGAQYAAWQLDQMESLADEVRRLRAPVLLAGDLNSTPWGWVYRQFTAASGLGPRSVDRTWRATWYRLPGLGVPIDHILCTAEMQLTRREVGPDVGSDHRPLSARVAWRDQ